MGVRANDYLDKEAGAETQDAEGVVRKEPISRQE